MLHPGDWDYTTTVVGIGTIVAAFALKAIPKLERYALVLVVFLGTALVCGPEHRHAPHLGRGDHPHRAGGPADPDALATLPDLAMVPTLLLGSFSVALVALAQGAGIRPAFANPDGSRSSSSRDFLGQGLGNVAGAFFQSTPTGGSLSRTAVSADGGSTSRIAGYIAAATVVLLVVVFGTFVGAIPEAVIGGLLFVIGVELVMGRMPDARLAWRTGTVSRALFVITLTLTLTVPLQWAIIGGAVLSLLAFVVSSGSRVDLHRATRDDIGWRLGDDVPAILPADEPIVLRVRRSQLLRRCRRRSQIGSQNPTRTHPGVLVMDLGALEHFSSTTLKSLEKMHTKFVALHSGLVLTGVEASAREVLARTGLLAQLGEQNVLPTDPHIGGSLDAGLQRGQALLSELKGMGL